MFFFMSLPSIKYLSKNALCLKLFHLAFLLTDSLFPRVISGVYVIACHALIAREKCRSPCLRSPSLSPAIALALSFSHSRSLL